VARDYSQQLLSSCSREVSDGTLLMLRIPVRLLAWQPVCFYLQPTHYTIFCEPLTFAKFVKKFPAV
jgi:hypothetical protein